MGLLQKHQKDKGRPQIPQGPDSVLKTLLQIAYLMGLILALTVLAYSFNLPNQGKYKSFVERSKQVPESEIESSRSAKTGRKASENKRPWLADSFLDMENMVDPDFGGLGRFTAGPKYQWPDGTRQEVPPGSVEWPLLA